MARAPHLDPLLTQPEPDDLGVQEFLDDFAVALTAGDGETIATMWETPAFAFSAEMVRPIATQQEVAEFFGGARAQYNKLGITDTKAEIIRLDELNDGLVNVRVRWPYLDANGEEMGAENSTYTLSRDHQGEWKIRIAVMHGTEAVN